MIISPKHLQVFKELMRKEYGVKYSDAEAHEAAINLVGYFELLMKIDYEQKQKRNKDSSK